MYSLGPSYYGCGGPDCYGPKADPDNDCPKCEYKLRRKAWEKEVLAEIDKKSPGPEADADWPLWVLHDYLNTTTNADRMYPKRQGPKWTVTVAYLVSILRGEESKIRSQEIWDRQEQREAQREADKRILGRADSEEDEH
jgi:hypothetical protein